MRLAGFSTRILCHGPAARPRRPARWLEHSAGVLVAAVLTMGAQGCTHADVPPRPVPQPEAQPELPSWYPEKPWTDQKTARVFLEGKVVFDLNRATLRPNSEQVLQKLVEYLKANPDVSRVRLEGHACELGSEEHNQGLSVRRSVAVADWLVDHGLDHMRLLAVAFGESRPLHSNNTAAGRAENRRAEFHVAELGGSPFQGSDPSAGGLILEVLSKEEREAAATVGEVPTAPEEEPVTPSGDTIGPREQPEPKGGDETPPSDAEQPAAAPAPK